MRFNTKKIALLSIVVILLIARVLAPAVMLKKVNAYLADFSDIYYAHIEDFDLSIWRGAYRFEKINVMLKADAKKKIL